MANLKPEVTRKQSTPDFPKNYYFLPPDMNTYLSPMNLHAKYSVLRGVIGILSTIYDETLLLFWQKSSTIDVSRGSTYASEFG